MNPFPGLPAGDLRRDGFPDPTEGLRRLLMAQARLGEARQAFFAWPNLRSACLALVAYGSAGFPGADGQAVLAGLLGHCFDAFGQAERGEEGGPARAFLEALLAAVPAYGRVIVLGERCAAPPLRWVPWQCPLPVWVDRHAVTRLVWTAASRSYRSSVAQRPEAQAAVLLRAGVLKPVDLSLLGRGD